MDFLTPGAIDQVGVGDVSVGELQKALSAGYGTDSSAMTGGRALIPEDMENTVINALAAKEADFKLTNLLKKDKVTSTVHEFTRRNDAGDYENIFVSEGGESAETDQDVERVPITMKYMQTYREVTLQMQVTKTLEDAVASEKIAGSLTLLKGLEASLFTGDSAIVPVQFDSINKQIMSKSSRKNVLDMGGKKFTDAGGEDSINGIAQMIYDNGGSPSHSFMPSVVAADIQALMRDRLRFGSSDKNLAAVAETYPTQFGDIRIAGKDAGADKMYRVKGPVSAKGDATKRPTAPVITSLTPATRTSGSGLPAGVYNYTVHAVNEYGISAASAAVSATVTAGEQVSILITPGDSKATGYIICRSKAGGTETAEMCRCAAKGSAAVTYVDVNEDIPGTGEMLVLSIDSLEPSISLGQLLPVMKFDLYPTKAAIVPFLICMFCSPMVKVPWYHGVIKNIGYTGNKYI